MLNQEKILQLSEKAREIRLSVIEALAEAGSGHTAGPLGMADVFSYLYFHALKHDPNRPDWPERDRLVLSNGHICPVLYATMCISGYADIEEFKKTFRKFGSKFQGHPQRKFLHALETSSGPLGSGLSQAIGMAISDKVDGLKHGQRFIYCLMSDGEMDEGNTWEAMMLAGREKLGNLITIVDRNGIQIDGNTEDVMPPEPLADKWRSFNWQVLEIDGHDFRAINEAVNQAKMIDSSPTVIIAKTTPGKGVKEFENDFRWHGKAPTKEEGEMALKEIGDKTYRWEDD